MLVEELMNKSDYEWYEELFTRDERKKFSAEEIDEIIDKSMDSARQVYDKFKDEIEIKGIKKLINSYGTEVVYNKKDESDTLIASYDKKENTITLFSHSIETLHRQIVKIGINDILDQNLLKNVILSHELYHTIEMNEEDIYTYSKIYKHKVLMFDVEERVKTASEIGAFHFTKLVNDLDFSPCIVGSLFEVTV